MTTSGTASFNLDIVEIIEEAYEQAGMEMRSGYDMRTARRSLNLLALDWANRGYNLWTVEQGAIPLRQGLSLYTLPEDTIDVIQMVLRQTVGTSVTDIAIMRVGMAVFATIPKKNTLGRPTQVWIDRQIVPEVNVWPIPQDNSYTLVYWRMKRIQDAGNFGELTYDIPARFLPCLTAGLAFKLAIKRPELADRIPILKAEYEEQWSNAVAEDRERVTMRLVPSPRRL